MKGGFGLFGPIAIVIVVVVVVAFLRAKLDAGASAQEKFKAKRMLTANELEFLARLEAAAPELRFCPQVGMGALLDPTASRSDGKAYFRQRGMFSQKIVDFVAQQRSDGAVVAIIELDDRTHDSGKDAKRDAMLASAGYKIIRWNSKSKPDAPAIRAALIPPSPSAERAEPTLKPDSLGAPVEPGRREPSMGGA